MALCGQVVVIVIVRRNVRGYEEEFLSEAAVKLVLHHTKDGVFVCRHDDRTSRVSSMFESMFASTLQTGSAHCLLYEVLAARGLPSETRQHDA